MRLLLVTLLLAACGPKSQPATSQPTLENAPPDAGPAPAPDALPPLAGPDRDGDRVIDICDVCPDDPETFQSIADQDGCPDRAIDDFGLNGDRHNPAYDNAPPPDTCPEELRYEP